MDCEVFGGSFIGRALRSGFVIGLMVVPFDNVRFNALSVVSAVDSGVLLTVTLKYVELV